MFVVSLLLEECSKYKNKGNIEGQYTKIKEVESDVNKTFGLRLDNTAVETLLK